MFGNGGLVLPVCSFLLLHVPVLTGSGPVKDRSEGRVEQRTTSTRLQPLSSGGHNVKQTSRKEVFQWWGEWSSWSSCSRSCGGGVRSQERHCLVQRLSTTHNVNSSYCAGSPKQYQLCPLQPCPRSTVSFKQHQCSQFNAKAFGRRYYQWIPLYPADYISISSKPCDLQCTTTSGERQLLVPAHDGTFCHDTEYQGVCIEGACQPVGCDGELYGSRAVDRCGLCGGSGTTCQRISGSYRKALAQLEGGRLFHIMHPLKVTRLGLSLIEGGRLFHIMHPLKVTRLGLSLIEGGRLFHTMHPLKVTRLGLSLIEGGRLFHIMHPLKVTRLGLSLIEGGRLFHILHPLKVTRLGLSLIEGGYVLVTHIPAGASDIQIIERHRTENILALSDEAGHFFFNGNSVFDNPQNFHVAGTVIKYRRPSSVFSDGLEYILAPGPTLQGLNAMVDQLRATDGSATSVYQYNSQLEAEDQSQEEEEEAVWAVRTPSPPPPAGMLVYRGGTSDVFSLNEVQPGPAVPAGYRSSSNSIDEPHTADDITLVHPLLGSPSVHSAAQQPEDAPYLLLEDLHYNHTHSNTHSVDGPLTDPPADTATDTHSVTHTDTHTAILVQGPSVHAAGSESNDFDVGLEPDVSLADMYRWKVSAYAPCSSTCTTGITTSYALCVRYDGTEVDDSSCDSVTRPEPTHEFCTGKECPPRWETSGWSECSRTCAEGVQYRTVRCWKMLSPGLDSSVYDSLCLSHDLHKPANRKVCLGHSCGPQWEVSEWSECSARCGSRGVRTREVRCSMEMSLCNKSSQPIESQDCEGPPCDRRWTVSDWGPCSGVCGEGRMVRAVTCRSSGGVVMSEDQCDQLLRPLAIYPCGDRDCAPHWVEQEWQQCNATCGRGVRRRAVVCVGLQAGVFKEFPDGSCDDTNAPETSSSCFQRPCSKWFTTAWSQCSKTCGRGVQVREVKCYQGQEVVTRGHSCNSAHRPEARQSCEAQSCPTAAPGTEATATRQWRILRVHVQHVSSSLVSPAAAVVLEDSCQDKPTANCALVLKVKLCSHWYYRKACCQSCRAPRP
ncbi:ADAMTS-like protein 2 isoform X4 [Pseudoliparis swirei]|uniref:ADAMTS-like protein 2 isoform X4 n=1 Tax=Pseudoliparis swirei TaxID=2059687 RepID=UPI0024BDC006|nr:ADAMTS-like protein 2 isoform X4 [Pseudoliparis swirei]